MSGPAAAVLLFACSLAASLPACARPRPPIDSCADRLHGVWVAPDGGRWMVLDNGATLEAYPLFDDTVTEGAPRVIDLRRDGQLGGMIKRRFMRRAQLCEGKAPVRVTACTEASLQLVLGEVTPPLQFEPCAWSTAPPARVETWRRE